MGTLVIDTGIVDEAYRVALKSVGDRGGEADMAAVSTLRGRPTLDVLTAVLADPVAAEEATWAFDDHVLDGVPTMEPSPGASETLAALDDRAIACAVTSSFSPEVRKAVIGAHGWGERFAAELSAHGRRRGHPAPDLLLEAMLELRVDSVGQVAIVGDHAADLVAGNRAGAGVVVGIGRRAELHDAPHTHLIDRLDELIEIIDRPRTIGHRRSSDIDAP